MRDDVLSMLVHAPSKEGKSTLASTAPTPMLVLDAEGGWKFIRQSGYQSGQPLRKITWDPLKEDIPQHTGEWDVAVVKVTSWQHVSLVYQYLTQRPHQFESIVVDSITEIQRRCKTNLRGTEQMQMQHWGELLNQMDAVIRGFRDLTLLDNTVRCVVFIAETRMKDGKWRPYMQGQIETSLPYWVDACGYLFTDWVPDEQGQPTNKIKKLLIEVSAQYESGNRFQGALPDIITNPSVSDMISTIYDEEK